MAMITKRIRRRHGKPVLDKDGKPVVWLDQHGKPRWDAQVYLGRDEVTGKVRFRSKSFLRKQDAETWANKLDIKRHTNEPIADARETLEQWLEHWLKVKSNAGGKRRIRERTAYDYGRIIHRWVKEPPEDCPRIGRLKLASVGTEHLERLYLFIAEQGRASGTIRHVHAVLHQALREAVRRKKLAWNPADHVTLPKGGDEDDDEVPDENGQRVPAMTQEQAERFLAAAQKDRYSALWHVLLTGGLRPSEAFALRWEDVDLDLGSVHVWRSLTRVPHVKGWKLTKLKSERANRRRQRRSRDVSLPAVTMRELEKWRTVQKRERLALGPEYKNERDLVFTTPLGTPLFLQNLNAGPWRRVMAEAGLGEFGPTPEKPEGQPGPRKQPKFTPAFRIYDLRHTCASLLLAAGESLKVVSEKLGHSTITLTADTYAHVLPKMEQESAQRMEQMFGTG